MSKRMTPAEIARILADAVKVAERELRACYWHEEPGIRRAYEALSAALDKVIYAAHEAYPDDPDVNAYIASIADPLLRLAACSCPCHADEHGLRDWPLLSDTIAGVTACAQCRPYHEHLT